MWTNQPSSNWRSPLKKPTQNQRLQLGIICREEKADVEKLALCFYSSRIDTQQLMLSFSGHIIGLLIAAVIKALMNPCEHPDHKTKISYSCLSTLEKSHLSPMLCLLIIILLWGLGSYFVCFFLSLPFTSSILTSWTVKSQCVKAHRLDCQNTETIFLCLSSLLSECLQ